MIRYVWTYEAKYLYQYPHFDNKNERIEVPVDHENPVFVNIIERDSINDYPTIKVKLFYANGETIEGWTASCLDPINITNREELFDGRFNA